MKRKSTPMDRAVWAACPRVDQWVTNHHGRQKCNKCPAYEMYGEHGKTKRACRLIVEEILKPALKAYKQPGDGT